MHLAQLIRKNSDAQNQAQEYDFLNDLSYNPASNKINRNPRQRTEISIHV